MIAYLLVEESSLLLFEAGAIDPDQVTLGRRSAMSFATSGWMRSTAVLGAALACQFASNRHPARNPEQKDRQHSSSLSAIVVSRYSNPEA
jgi:hypothetical protein